MWIIVFVSSHDCPCSFMSPFSSSRLPPPQFLPFFQWTRIFPPTLLLLIWNLVSSLCLINYTGHKESGNRCVTMPVWTTNSRCQSCGSASVFLVSPPHLSPLLGRFQLLLDLLQGWVTALRHGGIEFWHTIKRRGLEDDLERLARCTLVQLNDLHVFDDAPAQVHCICVVG